MNAPPSLNSTPTEADGQQALRDHLLEKAAAARARYPKLDGESALRLLDDRAVVRYATGLRFDDRGLELGEFAWAMPLGDHPSKGFCIVVRPCFEAQERIWAALVAYQIPPINYGEIDTPDDCGACGAALLGVSVESYYRTLCELADSVPAPAPAIGSQP